LRVCQTKKGAAGFPSSGKTFSRLVNENVCGVPTRKENNKTRPQAAANQLRGGWGMGVKVESEGGSPQDPRSKDLAGLRQYLPVKSSRRVRIVKTFF